MESHVHNHATDRQRLCRPLRPIRRRHRLRIIETETGHCLPSVKRRTTSPGSMLAEQAVNDRTLAPRRLAPERLLSEKSPYYAHSIHNTHPEINSASHVNINEFDVKQADSPPILARRRLAFCGPPPNMVTVSSMISSHDTEGTRPRCDIEVKCRGTLRPEASDFGSVRAAIMVVEEGLLPAVPVWLCNEADQGPRHVPIGPYHRRQSIPRTARQ